MGILYYIMFDYFQLLIYHTSCSIKDCLSCSDAWQVPYLQDPNTGIEMFESAEIVEYLRATYAA